MKKCLSIFFLFVMVSAVVQQIMAYDIIRLKEIQTEIEQIQVIVDARGGVSSTNELVRFEELRLERRQIQTQRLNEILAEMENINASVEARNGVSGTNELLRYEELRRELKRILLECFPIKH